MFSDRATLDAFRRGDPEVLTRVYRAHMPAVARLARCGFGFQSGGKPLRFRGYALDYEQLELVQETFVRAFAEPARLAYNGISPYEGYLVGIAKNIVIDQFRSRAARVRACDFVQADSDDGEQVAASDPEAALDLARLHRAVSDFVDGRPGLERRFVALRFAEGQSQEQVATRMKLSRNRVRTLERHFRRALYLELKAKGWTRQRSSAVLGAGLSTVLV